MTSADDYWEFRELRKKIIFCGEEDWKSFKKWAKERHDDPKESPWLLAGCGVRLWNAWWNLQEHKEKETLERKFSFNGKQYVCRVCGKKADESFFHELDYEHMHGVRAYAYVRKGTGLCKACYQAERKENRKQYMKEYQTQWYQDNKQKILERQRVQKQYHAEQDRAWKSAHREQINQHIHERKQTDPVYKLKCQARTTIYKSFARTGNVKSERCEKITGLPIDDLVSYLNGTYEKTYGKKWDGIEPVHIDHIVPLATANNESDVFRLCHYTNLQLLTAQDNLAKGSKYAEVKV